MIKAKGSLNGNVVDKQNLKGKINTSIEYIRIYPETQAKTITPTKQSQTVLPDENIYALSQVTVNPIPNNYIDPDGEYQVTDNGKYNIRNYNSVDVNVEKGVFPTGTINITENGTTDVTNYVSANVNVPDNSPITQEDYDEANDDLDTILEGTVSVNVYPPDWSEIGYSDAPDSLISSFNYAKQVKNNWNSSQTDLVNKFYKDSHLMYMPLVDTSNVTRMSGTFSSCSMLRTVPLLNTSNCVNMATMFKNCTYLEDIPIFDTSKVVNLSNFVQNCSSLTNDSLNNIMQMCINTTSAFTGTKTLAYLGLTAAQATTCQTLSNYQNFLAAGWTTGY